MHILLHALPIKIGGGVRHLENVLVNMQRFPDIQWTVIVNDQYKTVVESKNITYISFPNRYSGGIKRVYFDNIMIEKLIQESSFDLLISFGNLGPVKTSIPHILFQANARFFCKNIRHYSTLKQKVMFFLQKKLILAACKNAVVITPSETLKKMLIGEGVEKSRIVTLYHAVDRSTLGASEEKQEDDSFIFFYPSHFYNYKGVDVLLRAVNDLVKNHNFGKPFKVICTFNQTDATDDFHSMNQYVWEHNLENVVEFRGNCKQDEIAQYYLDADCMVFPSLCESFGFPLVEAKLYHLPAITADTEINQEISKMGSIYYRSIDPNDMAQKMLGIMHGKYAKFHYEDELTQRDWSQYAEEFYQIILKTVSNYE